MIWIYIYDILCLLALASGGFAISLFIATIIGYVLIKFGISENTSLKLAAVFFWLNMAIIIICTIALLVIDISNWRMML